VYTSLGNRAASQLPVQQASAIRIADANSLQKGELWQTQETAGPARRGAAFNSAAILHGWLFGFLARFDVGMLLSLSHVHANFVGLLVIGVLF